ncbi:MAG TPA: uroporphyrinogen-III synthase [Candidatus Binatia bacterium]|nr:uroporphyrinogen-III synthase [Candidatus Binatia bacterium]
MSQRILVTRPLGQAAELAELLAERGLVPVIVPTVEIDAESAAEDLDAALASLEGADWLILTSANGVEALVARLAACGHALPDTLRVAAVGPATASALRAAGLRVDHVPDEYLTVAIAGGLGEVRGRRVVLARADAATPDLRDALVERGADVEEVVAYRTVEGPASSRDRLHAALHADLAGTAFTSSSTVRGLLRLASTVDRQRARAVPAFCIGPVTAETARHFGFDLAAVAAEHTASGMADTIAAHFAQAPR